LFGHDRVGCAYPPLPWGECCSYGTYKGKEIVLDLLIDHDVPSLGHRKIILDGSLKKAGPSIQFHSRCKVCCEINFSS
jgi:hypothetical protein